MGLLSRLFGGGGRSKPDAAEAEPDTAPPSVPPPARVDPNDPSARLDAARERLRERIEPIEDEDETG